MVEAEGAGEGGEVEEAMAAMEAEVMVVGAAATEALERLILATLRRNVDGMQHQAFATAEFQDMKMRPALERALGRRGLLKA